ncbi:hypothetical protein Tco_1260525 [Tanacetum coccineum]
MTGPEPSTPLNEGTSNQNNTTTQSIIEGHVSALKELLNEQSNHDLINPMHLNFSDDIQDTDDEIIEINKKKEKGKATVTDEDLSKPFKEVLKCPFTRRIIEFSYPGHMMPTNVKIYDGNGDPEDHISRFTGIENQGEWPMFGMLRGCAKHPTEISKIIQRANKSHPNFKERWVSESNVIPNVPELMHISSFLSSHKCPELSKGFSDSIPKTVDEMLKRVDDYVRLEAAFRNTDFPKGEFQRKELPSQWGQRNDRPQRGLFRNTRRRPDHIPTFQLQEHHAPYIAQHPPHQDFRHPREQYRDNRAVLTLDSLVSTLKKSLPRNTS